MVITVYSLNQFHVWMQLRSFFFLGIGFTNFGLQIFCLQHHKPILIWFTSVQNEKSCQLTVIVVGMFVFLIKYLGLEGVSSKYPFLIFI